MKFLRSLFAGLLGVTAAHAAEPKSAKTPAEMMREMRLAWLTRAPDKDATTSPDQVVAVVMDWPLGKQTVTVLSSSVGDASLYTTATFGIIGGIGHERVRKAAQAFVSPAQSNVGLAVVTTTYPYIDDRTLYFYMVTPAGVRRASFPLADVDCAGSPARTLFEAAQAVVTELRLIGPKPK